MIWFTLTAITIVVGRAVVDVYQLARRATRR